MNSVWVSALVLAMAASLGAADKAMVVPQPGDVDMSGSVDSVDVQLVINRVLGIVIDTDGDGLCDSLELRLGTRPDVADSDGDGVLDGAEFYLGTLEPAAMALIEIPAPTSGTNPSYPLEPVAAPAPGDSVSDTRLHTAQRRVTTGDAVRHEYSRHDPFNAGHAMVLLLALATGEWQVYETTTVPYNTPGQLVRTVNLEEPRWDPVAPAILWGQRGFQLLQLNVVSGAETVIKDFATDATISPILAAEPDLYRITMKDEGESSADKRYWAFLIQGVNDDYRARYLIIWDRQSDTILGMYTIPLAESLIDWAGMSPNGNWVLIGGDWDNGGQLTGLTMANRELTQFHRLDYGTAHADVGLDSTGQEVVVMQNGRTDYIDLIPIDLATQPILDAGGSYAGTNRIPLLRLHYDNTSAEGLNSGVHISANYPGWCVVSTYIEPGLPEQNWLDRSIVLVELNQSAPRAFYLSKVYGDTGAYWEETHATMSADGSAVVWATNWGQNAGEERVWVMELAMPSGWESLR